MPQYLPLNRMSFASVEEDQFFSTCSSQPASRHMSIFSLEERGELPEGFDSTRRSSEPLVSTCLPRGLASSSSRQTNQTIAEGSPGQPGGASAHQISHNAASNTTPEQLVPSHLSTEAPRHRSPATGGEQVSAPHPGQKRRLPLVTRAEIDGHISKQKIDDMTRNIRAYLSASRDRGNSRNTSSVRNNENDVPRTPPDGPSRMTPTLPEDEYLVTMDNIAGILDIVVAGVRSFQDDTTQSNCRSLPLPNNTGAKPTLHSQNIVPGTSSIADPATTIYSPRGCFSLSGGLEEFGHSGSMPTTTYGTIPNVPSYPNSRLSCHHLLLKPSKPLT